MRDRVAGTTELVSMSSSNAQTNDFVYLDAISADGRFVAFVSAATNLAANDTNHTFDVFVRDRKEDTTERVSVSSSGAQANGESAFAAISGADGRFVAFCSYASNLVSGDTNRKGDVFIRDRIKDTTTRVSVGSRGTEANGLSQGSSISAGGRFVAFDSGASTLVASDNNRKSDVFVRDRVKGTTTLVSVARR